MKISQGGYYGKEYKSFKTVTQAEKGNKCEDIRRCSNLLPKRKKSCQVATHTIENIDDYLFITIAANVSDQVIFEDYTCNHNKATLTLITDDQPLTIKIKTRDRSKPITETMPANRTRTFEVEDFVRLTVSNAAEAETELGVKVKKTFCICCDHSKTDHSSCCGCSSSENSNSENCQIATHETVGDGRFLDYFVSPNTSEQVIFEDYTCNHNKTMLILGSSPETEGPPAVPLNISISTRNCPDKINAEIPAYGRRIFQVKDFEKLTVTNVDTSVTGNLVVYIQKTFCICCDNKKKQDKKQKAKKEQNKFAKPSVKSFCKYN